MKLTSPDFEPEARLDDRFSYMHDNLAPRVLVSDVPEDAVELAFICHDPDAPRPHGFTHWLRYGIPVDTSELTADGVGRDGVNDFKKVGWGGPKPPPGHGTHHYYVVVHAVDVDRLDVPAEGSSAFLGFNLFSHTLARASLVAEYEVAAS